MIKVSNTENLVEMLHYLNSFFRIDFIQEKLHLQVGMK